MPGFGLYLFVCATILGVVVAVCFCVCKLISRLVSPTVKAEASNEKRQATHICYYFGLVALITALPLIIVQVLGLHEFFEDQPALSLLVILPQLIGFPCSLFAAFCCAGELMRFALAKNLRANGASVLVGLLFAFSLPAVAAVISGRPSQSDKRCQDMNTLRQIGLGSLNYESAHMEFPRFSGKRHGEGAGLSWRVHILPYLEHGELYERFRLDEPWDSPHNKSLIKEMPSIYSSVWPKEKVPIGHTLFQRPTGNGAIDLGDGGGFSFGDITDGSSNTILIVQADPEAAVIWTKPADYYFEPKAPLRNLGHCRTNWTGWLGIRCDGSTFCFDANATDTPVALDEIKAMFTRAGDDVTPEDWR